MGLARRRYIPAAVTPERTASSPEHPATRWDLYRNLDGSPVTITDQQVRAIFHALGVVEEVRRYEGKQALWQNGPIECAKSRLLGRMLLDGLPPYDNPPPHWSGACDYGAWD